MLYFFKREKKFGRIHSFANCLSVCSVLDGKMRNTLKQQKKVKNTQIDLKQINKSGGTSIKKFVFDFSVH